MASRKTLTQAEFESLAAFRHALRRFANFSTEAARRAGLTAQQHQALLSIKGHPGDEPITIGGLADHLLVAPHTGAELVARLETAGLIVKLGTPGDRRVTGLALTPKAEEALAALSATHLREIRLLAPRMTKLLDELAPEELG